MSHKHPHGKPRSILKFSETKEVIIDIENLNKIFDHTDIQDYKVVILSLIGVFRGGKSFLLDYCLRFLYANFPSVKNHWKQKPSDFKINDNWMGEPDEPLTGFSWQSGAKRDTIGIIMWSDVFLHTIDKTGEKIAIFVMDTQGLFDNDSTPTDNSRIFSLGTLISSIQVLNVLNRIQEDQLQYLQFATEFTKFTALKSSESTEKPFQNLTFFIRDWNNPHDYKYGMSGGEAYITEILEPKPSQKIVLKSVRESINNCFGKIECCLLPHPGKIVANNKDYNGNWSEMDGEFRHEIRAAIEHILHPDNLIPKRVDSSDIKVSEMKDLIMSYLESFKSNDDVNVLTIYELTVENRTTSLIKKCNNEYKRVFTEAKEFFYDVDEIHKISVEKTMEFFDKQKKMGTADEVEIIRGKLKEEIEITFGYLKNDTPLKIYVLFSRVFRKNRLRSFLSKRIFFRERNKEEIVAKETVPEVNHSEEPTIKPTTEEIIKPIMSWTLFLLLLALVMILTIGITVIINFIGVTGVVTILAIIIGPIIFKLYKNGVEIPDAIMTASTIVTDTSKSIDNAATSLSSAASASASAMSAVKRVTDVLKK